MSKEYLQGKMGTGLRAVWVGEKTTTSFAVYVLVRNMSSTAYNYIHDTTATNVGTLLDNLTNVKVRVKNVTTGGFGTGTDPSGNWTISNLEDDPLVYRDVNGDVILDSTQWYGLRVRRFEFTGLTPGTSYTMEPFTDAVNATSQSLGTLRSFTFEVSTLRTNFLAGVHYSCDNQRMQTDPSADINIGYGGETWWDAANIHLDGACDLCISNDDMSYARGVGSSPVDSDMINWIDPISVTSDDSATTLAQDYINGSRIRDCSLNVEEQSTYDTYALTEGIFNTLLNPVCIYMGMKASIESTDAGDHVGLQNNSNLHFSESGPNTSDAFIIDYNSSNTSLTTVKPSDSDTVNSVHGGLNNDPVRDPYSETSGTFYDNFKIDVETSATQLLNHKVLYEYLLARQVGPATNTVAWRDSFTAHAEFGTTLAADPYIAKGFWRKREHPLVDIFYTNGLYHSDPTTLAGLYNQPLSYPIPTNICPPPTINIDPNSNKSLGEEQKLWLETEIASSTKDFIIIVSGDPMQKLLSDSTDWEADNEWGPYGQPDGMGSKSTAELNSLMQNLVTNNPNKGILILTGDRHTTAMTNDQDNILQLVGVQGWGPALREFTATNDGSFVAQYPGWQPATRSNGTPIVTPRAMSRFVVTPDKLYAYNIEAMVGNNLSSDVGYFEKGGTEWKFTTRSDHNFQKAIVTIGNLTALRTI